MREGRFDLRKLQSELPEEEKIEITIEQIENLQALKTFLFGHGKELAKSFEEAGVDFKELIEGINKANNKEPVDEQSLENILSIELYGIGKKFGELTKDKGVKISEYQEVKDEIAEQVEEIETFFELKGVLGKNWEGFKSRMKKEHFNQMLKSKNVEEFVESGTVNYFPDYVIKKADELANPGEPKQQTVVENLIKRRETGETKSLDDLLEEFESVVIKLGEIKDKDININSNRKEMELMADDFWKKKENLAKMGNSEDEKAKIINEVNKGVDFYSEIRRKLREWNETGEAPEKMVESSIISLAEELGVELNGDFKSGILRLEGIKNGEEEINANNVEEVDVLLKKFFNKEIKGQESKGEGEKEILEKTKSLYYGVMKSFIERRTELEKGETEKKGETEQEKIQNKVNEILHLAARKFELLGLIDQKIRVEGEEGQEAYIKENRDAIEEVENDIRILYNELGSVEEIERILGDDLDWKKGRLIGEIKNIVGEESVESEIPEVEELTKETPAETPEPEPEKVERREAPETPRKSIEEIEKTVDALKDLIKEEGVELTAKIKESIKEGKGLSEEEIAEAEARIRNLKKLHSLWSLTEMSTDTTQALRLNSNKEAGERIDNIVKAHGTEIENYRELVVAFITESGKSFDKKLEAENPDVRTGVENLAKASSGGIITRIKKLFGGKKTEVPVGTERPPTKLEEAAIDKLGKIRKAESLDDLVEVVDEIIAERKTLKLKKNTIALFDDFKIRFLDEENRNSSERNQGLKGWIANFDDIKKSAETNPNFKDAIKGVSEEYREVAKELLERVREIDELEEDLERIREFDGLESESDVMGDEAEGNKEMEEIKEMILEEKHDIDKVKNKKDLVKLLLSLMNYTSHIPRPAGFVTIDHNLFAYLGFEEKEKAENPALYSEMRNSMRNSVETVEPRELKEYYKKLVNKIEEIEDKQDDLEIGKTIRRDIPHRGTRPPDDELTPFGTGQVENKKASELNKRKKEILKSFLGSFEKESLAEIHKIIKNNEGVLRIKLSEIEDYSPSLYEEYVKKEMDKIKTVLDDKDSKIFENATLGDINEVLKNM